MKATNWILICSLGLSPFLVAQEQAQPQEPTHLPKVEGSETPEEAAPPETQSQEGAPADKVINIDQHQAEQEPSKPEKAEKQAETDKKPSAKKPKPSSERAKLEEQNALFELRHKLETRNLRAELNKLKMEKERLAEELALQELKRKKEALAEDARRQEALEELKYEAQRVKINAEREQAQAKRDQLKLAQKTTELESKLKEFATKLKTDQIVDQEPETLKSPLREDGTLIVSDRRVALNGPITYQTADHITERIHFYNNQDTELPIFIVIDASPGGSVIAGFRILKAMEESEAPVHVVVKSFAASMAAGITTLAEHSYAYPNAIILHHQMMWAQFGNVTEQREALEEAEEWWRRLATPIAEKMGLSRDEFIKKMYDNRSSGDWAEFADRAQELKWVDHVVKGIEETSVRHLLSGEQKEEGQSERVSRLSCHGGLEEQLNEKGQPVIYLPRLMPFDGYHLYDPQNYYRIK